jgi:hypothetical protein
LNSCQITRTIEIEEEDIMRSSAPRVTLALLGLSLALACSDGTSPTDAVRPAFKAGGRSGFGFNGSVRGFPTGAVRLTGGGSFDLATASNTVPTETSVASAGGFDCSATVAQGPLAGCAAGEGVRWDTAQLLASTTFKCTGSDAAKPAVTSARTAVLLADFYRAGDGDDESFTAQMIVSDGDLADDISGIQNLWVQGVGCGTAIVNFN